MPSARWAHFGPTPANDCSTSSSHGQFAAELLDRARGNGVDLIGLALVECRRPDQRVDLIRGERDDVFCRGSGREEAQADRQALLVAGADGDDAGHELLERRVVAPLGQLEHRRLRVRLDRLRDALHGDVDVERLLALCCLHAHLQSEGGATLRGERGVAALPGDEGEGRREIVPSNSFPLPLRPRRGRPPSVAPPSLHERRHHRRAKQLDRLFVTAQRVGDEVLEADVGKPPIERDGLFRRAGEEGVGRPGQRVLRHPR